MMLAERPSAAFQPFLGLNYSVFVLAFPFVGLAVGLARDKSLQLREGAASQLTIASFASFHLQRFLI